MDINRVPTGTYGSLESSLSVQNVGKGIKSEQTAVKVFSVKRRIKDESPAPKREPRLDCLDCLVPSCISQMDNQNIPERKVSHCVTTNNISIQSRNTFASPERPYSGSSVIDPGSQYGTLLAPSIISENRAATTGYEVVVDVARGGVSKTFTAEEAAETLRKTTESLITSLSYFNISRDGYGLDQRDEMTGIFIDFILYQEGLVNDRCFTVESSPDKYVAGKTLSQAQVEEIQAFLSDIFTERSEKCSKDGYSPILRYSLDNMLVDYLNKKENVPDDLIPTLSIRDQTKLTNEHLLENIFPFFGILLAGRGMFSELVIIFNFAVKFRQELIDSYAECPLNNLLTVGLRTNKSDMREYFNGHVLDVIFLRRCDGIINTLFDDYPLLPKVL